MKEIKSYDLECTFVSKIQNNKNFCSEKYMICGNEDVEEFSMLFKFDLNKILQESDARIRKVELAIYLCEVKLEKTKQEFFLNSTILKDKFDLFNVTYSNMPESFKDYNMYSVTRNYEKKYIKFDITNLCDEALIKNDDYICLMFFGTLKNALALFQMKQNMKRPYLKITYEVDENEDDKLIEEYIKEENKKNVNIEEGRGFFINHTGKIITNENYSIIPWDEYKSLKNIKCGKCNRDIILKNKGLYLVDYSLNATALENSIMSLIINNVEIPYSRVNVLEGEHLIYGSILIDVTEDNSVVKLIVKSVKLRFTKNSTSATIRFFKI